MKTINKLLMFMFPY